MLHLPPNSCLLLSTGDFGANAVRRRPLSLAGGSLRAKSGIFSQPQLRCSGLCFSQLSRRGTPSPARPRSLAAEAPPTPRTLEAGSVALGRRHFQWTRKRCCRRPGLLGNRDGPELSVNPGPILGRGGRAWVAVASGAAGAERPLGRYWRAVAERFCWACVAPPPGWNRLPPSARFRNAFAWLPRPLHPPGQLGVRPAARRSSLLHF